MNLRPFPGRMRAFVAVEVPPDPSRADRAAPAHLTLRFLGEVDPGRLPEIEAALRPAAAGQTAFDVRLEGVGAFPSAERPRVVWIGATAGAGELVHLAGAVADALAPVVPGAGAERFVPHVTLFRVRSRADRARADALLTARIPAPAPREFRVREIALKESRLRPTGAEHRTVARFPLSGAEPAGLRARSAPGSDDSTPAKGAPSRDDTIMDREPGRRPLPSGRGSGSVWPSTGVERQRGRSPP